MMTLGTDGAVAAGEDPGECNPAVEDELEFALESRRRPRPLLCGQRWDYTTDLL